MDRFSTDIDLDLVAPIADESALLDYMKHLLSRYGVVKEVIKKRSTFFFLLSYSDEDMNIKIEINTRIWQSNIYEVVNFFGISIQAQNPSTIFANKLVALTDRKILANRDIYDVHFFFKNRFSLNEALLFERTQKTRKEYLALLIIFLSKSPINILQWLGEVLDPKQKIWVKERLVLDLNSLLQFQMTQLCSNESQG